MKEVCFKDFVQKFPHWQVDLEVVQKDDPVFKRIICRWQETFADNTKLDKNQVLNHEYLACIDTRTGEIYNDDIKTVIYFKHALLLFARPVHLFIKTLWHLSILPPLVLEIAFYVYARMHPKEKQITWQDIALHTFQSMTDIVRTPIYGTAMILVHLFAITWGCISPNSLYHTRAWVGYLERKMLRMEDPTDVLIGLQLSPCFSPIASMMKTYNKEYDYDNQKYISRSLPLKDEEGIKVLREKNNRIAEHNIDFKRTVPNLFHPIVFPDNQEYHSKLKGCLCFC